MLKSTLTMNQRKDMSDRLQDILIYNMTEEEARAFKVCMLWEETIQEELPGYQTSKLSKKGDPRKCSLFKYCFKLIRETKGLLKNEEYRLWVRAQVQVMKNITDGRVHALVDEKILAGDKAWVRWKMWKSKYDKKINKPAVAEVKESLTVIKGELKRTRKFLESQYQGMPSLQEIERNINDRMIIRWLTLGKVSPYYVLLSPLVRKAMSGTTFEDQFVFDLAFYKNCITPEVEKFFEEEIESDVG